MKRIVMMLVVCMIGIVQAKTVAYWPMTKSDDGNRGVVRCAESSDNDLYVGRPANVAFGANDLGWNLPPNPHMSGAAAEVGGFLVTDMLTSAAKSDAVLTNDNANLAKALAPDHDFTVEGWARLNDLPAMGTSSQHYIMIYASFYKEDNSTRQRGGWRWRLTRPANEENISMGIDLVKNDGSNNTLTNMVQGLTPVSLTNEWHHYAVVFKENEAQEKGVWKFYIDRAFQGEAESKGTLYYSRSSISYTAPKVGFVGGFGQGWSPIGDFACWRVSDEALEPEQFLCYGGAGTTVPTSKTLNYWKLSGTAGGVDGRDFVGTANLSEAVNRADAVTDDKPTVPNPDATIGFNGDSGENTGSYRSGTAYNTHNKYLYFNGREYLESVLRSKDGWTMEGYFKMNGPETNNRFGWLFVLCKNEDGNTSNFGLRCYGTNDDDLRCCIVDANVFSEPKIEITDDSFSGKLESGAWTHFALSMSHEMLTNVEQVVYRFYINGNQKSVLTNVWKETVTSGAAIKSIAFGSAYGKEATNARSFVGQLSSFRLSKGALEPNEFLCATSSVQPVSDLAYWPLDNANGAADGVVAKGYADYALDKESGTVAGSGDRARSRIPAEKGVPTGNVGSVAIGTDGSVAAAHLGGDLNFGASWSVEGYLKFNAGSTVDICGTYDAVSGKGWKLVLDRSGETPAFKLYAAAGETPFINAAFAGTGAFDENGWNHLLLTHDKNGTWNLKVNRVDAGTLSSTPHGTGATAGVTDFYIGSGVYDIWRAATGILPLSDSLYFAPNGLVITFR